MAERWIFKGHIAGLGSTSGLRAVVGIWHESPFGAFADVMVQEPTGHRTLLAPNREVADFIAGTYSFDAVDVVDIAAVLTAEALTVDAGPLAVRAGLGKRSLLGWGLRAVPRPLAVQPRWLRMVGPLAGVLSPGARTSGSAGSGRVEYYGVTDLRSITTGSLHWSGRDAGALATVRPPVTFGFSSVPPQPSLATVQTTIVGT